MGNAPHIRTKGVWAGLSPADVSVDVKAGDLVVFTHFNYGTSFRGNYSGITAAMGGVTSRLTATGSSAFALLAVARATTDYTATLTAAGNTPTVGTADPTNTTYAMAQTIVCFDNVDAFQWGAGYEAPFTANALSGYGRPRNVTSSASTIASNHLSTATHAVFFGADTKTSTDDVTPFAFDPPGTYLYDVAMPSFWRHTVTSSRYIDLSTVDTSEAISYQGASTGNMCTMPVSALLFVCSEAPDGGGDPTLPPLAMGDGTPVTLEGYWDGVQLLPAEFVGLASA